MENELSFNSTGVGGRSMGVVPPYDRVTFPYTDNSATAVALKRVAQDSMPSHRNSHR